MVELKDIKDLNDEEINSVAGGVSLNMAAVLSRLASIKSSYPEINEILNAYKSGNYLALPGMIHSLINNHPELSYILK